MHIEPYKNSQKWSVDATFDQSCVASVNFNVPGKPNPPSAPLQARVWGMVSIAGVSKNAILFSDPSSTVAPADLTIDIWTPNDSNEKQ